MILVTAPFRFLALVSVVLVALSGALPKTQAGPAPPSAEEVRIGREAAARLEKEYKVVTDAAVTERIARVSAPIVAATDRPGVAYTIRVLDVDVANALALPGGFIYLTKPMLEFVRSDHELAAVLAHEMVHVAHVHGMEMIRRQTQAMFWTILVAALTRDARVAQGTRLASIGMLAAYVRDLERDADLTGIVYLDKTPYTPVAMLTLMERIAREEQYRASFDLGAWADHPKPHERVAYIEADLKRRGIPIVRRLSANYLRLTVRDVKEAQGMAELLLNDRVIVRLRGLDRLQEVAARLDFFFNADMASYEVGVRQDGEGWTITARNIPVLTVTPEDAIHARTTVKDLALTIHARLRAAIEEDARRRKLDG